WLIRGPGGAPAGHHRTSVEVMRSKRRSRCLVQTPNPSSIAECTRAGCYTSTSSRVRYSRCSHRVSAAQTSLSSLRPAGRIDAPRMTAVATSLVSEAGEWFAARSWTPFAFQREVWAAYLGGESGLIHAATGTGKTLAAWIGPLMEWGAERHGALSTIERPARTRRSYAPALRVLWLTPLRALAADTRAALVEVQAELAPEWTVETRTGDTSAMVRARQSRQLPTALVTTPESLCLMLTRPDAPALFDDLRLVVVDEWHELMGSKRGVLVELALARLRRLRPGVRTWGLSATSGNLAQAHGTLRGVRRADGRARIVRGAEPKDVIVDAAIPPVVERFPWAGHLGTQMLPQVVAAIEEGRTAIVFTNT